MKKEIIHMRCSKLDKKIIANKSADSGLSISTYMLNLALGHEPKYRLTDDEIEIYKMLHKYVRNFTNISNMYKARNPSINDEVRYLIEELKKHLSKFQ